VNGFLQRIAANAQIPAATVHPLVPPLFSLPEKAGSEEEISALVRSNPHRKDDAAAPREAPPATRTRDAARESHLAEGRPRDTPGMDIMPSSRVASNIPARGHETPAVHAMGASPADSGHLEQEENASVEPLPLFAPSAKAGVANPEGLEIEPAPPQPSASGGPLAAAHSYVPLVDGDYEPLDAGAARPPRTNPAMGLTPGGIAPVRPPLMAQGSAREPDEIQINIGRIEVVAVQSTSPRPPETRAKRMAPSLEEFLRRRGGRSS
jgi:hypothetical protein